MDAEAIAAETIAACASMAGLPYDGEPVDQLEHALQAAALALTCAAGEDEEFVVACLLHDIARAPAVAGLRGDEGTDHHGSAGARWLAPRFGARVAWLAEQHVAAKRYLVATDPDYVRALSPVSRATLVAQGGAMGPTEMATFVAHPDHDLALALRRIDDRAKIIDRAVPGLETHRRLLVRVART